MKNLKFNLALPILAVAFAVSAAFASQKTPAESSALEQGYVHTTEPCKKSIECSPIGAIQCTSEENLVFAMDGSTGCDRPLYFN